MAEVTGLSWVFKTDTTGGTPAQVGGQQGGSLQIGAREIDVSSKDNANWDKIIVGRRNWTLSGDGVVLETDTAWTNLESSALAGTLVDVSVTTPGSNTYSGTGIVTQFDTNAPHDDAYTYSVTIRGNGTLSKA